MTAKPVAVRHARLLLPMRHRPCVVLRRSARKAWRAPSPTTLRPEDGAPPTIFA